VCGGARHLAVVSVGLEFTLLAPRNFAEPFRFLVKKKCVHPCLGSVPSAGKVSCNFFYVGW
jgi:hypothetical protein